MEQGSAALLADRGIHGFNTLADLDIGKLTEDALKRWLRPNEVHAILSNYVHFEVQPQPVNLPPSGSLLLFDRKMLRNFRKDGHRWKKKKDGKTIQEAHEKLKIGTEERIHVYYARNEDDPNFYRRCYWLLDRNLERIVLVHYRQTSEENAMQLLSMPVEPKEVFPPTDSPLRSLNSTTGSNNSELMGSVVYHEEINSCEDHAIYSGSQVSPCPNTRFNECGASTLDELERLAWKDILEKPNSIELTKTGNILSSSTQMGYQLDSRYNDNFFGRVPCSGHSNLLSDSSYPGSVKQLDSGHLQLIDGGSHMPDASPKPVQSSIQDTVFSIVDVSPSYANTSVETKIIVVGHFSESQKHLAESNMFCVLGGQCVPAEPLQTGVYRIVALPHMPGFVDLYLSLDGHTPISQAINFEYYSVVSSPSSSRVASPEVNSEEPMHIEFLTRLVHLLFSTSNIISIISDGMSENSLREANQLASLTSTSLENNWLQFLSLDNNDESSSSTNLQHLFKLVLKNKLQEWLLLRVAEGCKTTVHDIKGLGVIHLCAILDYAWSVPLFSMSSLSLDFRDACGWTALHWSAYYGREKTVAALLSAGANPSLVTDPSSDFPGGRTAADLASEQGHEGLGAYLAERGLKAHFRAMTLSGNAPPPSSSTDTMNQEHGQPENFTEQELCLKDSLAAYRNAADAADRIQTAFRERSHTLQIKAARLSNTSNEATSIVAALKIQKAFRSYNRRKVMRAAVRIQGTFRTWQARNNFLKMRQHALKIQAVFRGHQVRKQYLKVVWSVGVLEKVVLRWRLKRKGLRGLKAEISKSSPFVEEENCVEEDFYRISREQAEERIRRSVVRVQAMFRSYRAQQEYRRMKLAFNQAKLECNDFFCSSRQF